MDRYQAYAIIHESGRSPLSDQCGTSNAKKESS